MILRLLIHGIAVVLLLMLAGHFLGGDIIDTVVSHITDGFHELAALAKNLAANGTAGGLIDRIRDFFGGLSNANS
ncbi:hypothetical protein [Azonexus hydrophilus]|uniref:Secreted protein n=1 Tax=Azonexus hydrophilus TaxID=418702 RepID=A0ABZ2XBR4_9RHOO